MADNDLNFQFPDEKEDVKVEVEASGDIEIEVEDDTPPEDRGRKPMTEAPDPLTEEELSQYKDKRLKDRLAHFNKGYHDERRAKEQAVREREEAVRIAQQILAENQQLKGNVDNGNRFMLEQAKGVAEKELAEAKREYKVAYEAGDADAVVNAQEALTGAKLKLDRLLNYRQTTLQNREQGVQPQAQAPQAQAPASPQPTVDEKALAWKQNNQWFNKDREMTGFALAVHAKLVEEEGLDPKSDTYYERINSRMREKFPEKFQDTVKARRSTNVVAPATRSTAPRKVVLSVSQVSIAKKLGLSPEQYARELIKLSN